MIPHNWGDFVHKFKRRREKYLRLNFSGGAGFVSNFAQLLGDRTV